jgi:hypothetical protein
VLLRARSDAALPVFPREETIAAMLTDWDKDYDFSEGDADASNPKHKSVLELRVYAGLDTIVEECGHSDFDSSQDISFNEKQMTAMQYGSSILLDFDYSLQTNEQPSEVSFEKPSEPSSVEELATTRVRLDRYPGILRTLGPFQLLKRNQ